MTGTQHSRLFQASAAAAAKSYFVDEELDASIQPFLVAQWLKIDVNALPAVQPARVTVLR